MIDDWRIPKTLAAKDLPSEYFGERTITNGQLTVDEDVYHAFGYLVRIRISRPVPHTFEIEHHDVGVGSRAEPATLRHAVDSRRKGSHRADCRCQVHHFVLDDVLAQLSGKRAVASRVGHTDSGTAKRTVGCGHRPGLHHQALDVPVVHVEGHDAGTTAKDYRQRRFDGILSPRQRDLGKSAPFDRGVRRVSRDPDPIGTASPREV